jgi:hypothetical protein
MFIIERLRESEVDEVKFVHFFWVTKVIANHDVVWLEITMYVSFIMECF